MVSDTCKIEEWTFLAYPIIPKIATLDSLQYLKMITNLSVSLD